MSDLIVIIDNWSHRPDGTIVTGKLSRNIINFIESTPDIKTAVLASYSCSRELFSDTVWYLNRKQAIKNYNEYVSDDYQTNLSRNMQTWEGMLGYYSPSIFQIAMREIEELSNYVIANNIKNIYMSGVAWEICVRNRPLGYESINKNIPNVNVLVDTSCIFDANANSPDMSTYTEWKKLSDTIYQYKP